MKEIDIKEYDEEKIELLKRIMGRGRPEAISLLFLIENETATLREIEKGTPLRQGEVSTGTTQLEKDGFVTVKLLKKRKGRKGRPEHVCTVLPKDKLLAVIKEKESARIKKIQRDIKQVEQIF